MQSDGEVAAVQLRELSEYACWQHPFRESHIYMHPAQQQRVQAQILGSFESENPSEVGGLLLGRIILERAGMSIVIEDVEFVEGSGKYFNSSPADLTRLTSVLNGSAKRADLTYVGYFRSHIREGLFLSAEDGELAEGRLRHPDAIFLVVKPYENGICMAGFFCWQNGSLEKEFSYLEAPFGSLEKRGTGAAEESGGMAGQPDAPSGSEPETAAAELETATAAWGTGRDPATQASGSHRDRPAALDSIAKLQDSAGMANAIDGLIRLLPPEPARRWQKLAVKAAALVCIGVIAGYTGFWLLGKRLHLSTVHHPGPGIGLHVDQASGGQLDVTWNRDLTALGGITGGQLSIVDGAIRHELNLDAQQLHNGKLAYFPTGNIVQFRLELFLNADRSVSESIRTVTAGLPAEAWAGRRMGKAPVFQAIDNRSKTLKPPPGSNLNVAAKQSGASRAHTPDIQIAALPFPRFPRIPQSRPTFVLAPDARGAAAVRTHIHRKPESLPSKFANAPARTAFTAVQARPVSNAPGQIEHLRAGAQRPPAVAIAEYVGPVVIQQISPRVPVRVASLVTSEQMVQITADIDAAGEVTSAELTATKGAASASLGPAALEAVLGYRFRPASRRGVPVPSRSVISFRFKPRMSSDNVPARLQQSTRHLSANADDIGDVPAHQLP